MPVVTQRDDGKHTGTAPGKVPTSSASMPSVVFGMPADLDVKPGSRVLEIGTGTGWNAALLAHRLRVENVVTVGGGFGPQRFAIGIGLRACVHAAAEKRGGARPVWFYGLTDRSWACILFRDGDTASV